MLCIRPIGLSALVLAATAFVNSLPANAAILNEIRQLRDRGAVEEALIRLDGALIEAPEDVDLLLLQGQILTRIDRPSDAARTLDRAIELAPAYVDLHVARAQAIAVIEGPNAALSALAPLMGQREDHAGLHMLAARLYLQLGDPESARQMYGRVLVIEPSHGEALIGNGDASKQAGDVEAARGFYERALQAPGVRSLAARRLVALEQGQVPLELILDTTLSWLDEGQDDWREATTALAFAPDENNRLYLSTTYASRYSDTDVMLSASYVRRLNAQRAVSIGIDLTPGADFLPKWRLRLGADASLAHLAEALTSTTIFGEIALADYSGGYARSLTAGLTQYFGDGSSWLTLRSSHTIDDEDSYDLGLSARLDVGLHGASRVYLGYSHETDRDRQGAKMIHAWTIGGEYRVTPEFDLFTNLTYEKRPWSIDRVALGMGVKLRFGNDR